MSTRSLIRLSPALSPTTLPAHPSLAAQQRSPPAPLPSLASFVERALTEAIAFTTTTLPSTFTPRAAKGSPPATAAVRLMGSTAVPNEAWFARRSEHGDAARDGTASMAEFTAGLFEEHSMHEMAYTPNVFDAVEVLSWGSQIEALPEGRRMGDFSDVDMSIHEIAHRMPSPLTNRVFPVLLVRAKTGPELGTGFVVLQIPVELWAVDAALYSNGRHRNEKLPGEKGEKVVMGRYVSVERVKYLDEGEETTDAVAFDEHQEAEEEEVAKKEEILEDAEAAKHEEVAEHAEQADIARGAEVVDDIEVKQDAEVTEHVAQGDHLLHTEHAAETEPVMEGEGVKETEPVKEGEDLAETKPAVQSEPTEAAEDASEPKEPDDVGPLEQSEQPQAADNVAVTPVPKGKERTIEWIMATASDAKGKLPMSVQKMGVPGAIVKDVGFFIGWAMKNRK